MRREWNGKNEVHPQYRYPGQQRTGIPLEEGHQSPNEGDLSSDCCCWIEKHIVHRHTRNHTGNHQKQYYGLHRHPPLPLPWLCCNGDFQRKTKRQCLSVVAGGDFARKQQQSRWCKAANQRRIDRNHFHLHHHHHQQLLLLLLLLLQNSK